MQLSRAVKNKIASLQVVRFVAASLVVLLHATETMTGTSAPRPLAALGPLGVDLFFVLSGYIMATVGSHWTAGEFLARRLGRVLPIYYLLTVFMMVIMALAGEFTAGPLASSFLMVPVPGERTYLNVAWTLDYELLFYGGFAIVLAFGRRGLVVVLAALAMAMVARSLSGGPVLDFVGNPLILEFLAGVVAAKAPKSRPAAWASVAAALVMFCGVALQPAAIEGVWARPLLLVWPSALLIYGAAQVSGSGAMWSRMAYLGDASYAAYLAHQFPLSIAKAFRHQVPTWPAVAILFVLCWALAILVHEGLEKPLLQRLRRWRGTASAPPSAVPAEL